MLKRHGVPPAPERKTTTTWKEFIRTHMDVLVATDFFTAEVWTLGGLVTYYVLFFIHRTGCEFSVTPKRLAWATVEGNSVIRARCDQQNGGTPWPRRGREWA
jgi:hypothetical protein